MPVSLPPLVILLVATTCSAILSIRSLKGEFVGDISSGLVCCVVCILLPIIEAPLSGVILCAFLPSLWKYTMINLPSVYIRSVCKQTIPLINKMLLGEGTMNIIGQMIEWIRK